MSDKTISGPPWQEHITRDWRFWAALAGFVLSVSVVFAVISLTLALSGVRSELAGQSGETLCRARATAGVAEASAQLDIAVADLFVIATAQDGGRNPDGTIKPEVLAQAVEIEFRKNQLLEATEVREQSLIGCLGAPPPPSSDDPP